MRRIVCDTGPVLHLQEAGLSFLLHQLGELFLPPAVLTELESLGVMQLGEEPAQVGRPDALLSTRLHQAVHVLSPSARDQARALEEAGLVDRGEAEALALARQVSADWLLTDDAAARVLAGEVGLEVHGSLGVVLWAAATRRMDRREADEALSRLAGTSIWISRRVLEEARVALHELFL